MMRDLLQEAYTAMRHNRRRTALTMLGMAWGIATVVMLLAYGNGFGQACANIFANFGTKLVIVVPGQTSMQAGGQKAGIPVRFTQDDVETLLTNLPQITHITPKSASSRVCNMTPGFSPGRSLAMIPTFLTSASLKMDQGRFYNLEDQVQRARVAVIGSEAKEKLFSGRNALGERIRLDGLSFEVVGVLSPKMQEGNDDINRVVYIPFTTMAALKDTRYLDTIWFNYQTPEYERLEQSVRTILAVPHKFNQSDRQAVQSIQSHDAGSSVRNHYDGTEDPAGLHWHAYARHRRRGIDEHHAGVGHATHARDRRAEGAGRAAALHPDAVSCRSSDHHFYRWRAGSVVGIRRGFVCGQAHFIQRVCQEWRGRRYPHTDRSRHVYLCRLLFSAWSAWSAE